MRIAHISATFPPSYTGTGLVCYHNARELARRGHEVHVFTARTAGTPAEEQWEGVFVHRLKPLFHFGNAPFLPGLMQLRRFEILHLHFPFFGGEFTAVASRRSHTPLVITYHQDVHLQGAAAVIERVLRHTASRATLRTAQRVLFTTQDYGRVSYARKLLAGREKYISENPNGVDTHFFTPGSPPAELRQHYHIHDDNRLVLLVAGLDVPHYFKGVEKLVSALVELPPNFKAIIVGEGSLRPAYEAKVRSLGVDGRVYFAGRVSDADLPGYYRLADLTVLPSLTMGEAFGLVLVESLACATPVIASNLPGVRTVVTQGVDGFLVEPGDVPGLAAKIKQMLDLPEAERHAMGAAGRRKVEQYYTWELAAQRLEAIYQELC